MKITKKEFVGNPIQSPMLSLAEKDLERVSDLKRFNKFLNNENLEGLNKDIKAKLLKK